MIIVSDTSPVSNLILIGRLDLLRQLYTTVIVPASVDAEIGTRIARDNGLKTLGLIGTLVKAKEERLIPLVGPILDDLRNIAGFWITDKFYHKILLDIGESKES